MPTREFNTLSDAAYHLGSEGIMFDPLDEDILIAAAELVGSSVDLSGIDDWTSERIICAFDAGWARYLEGGE